ncbi:hypothetical protein GCM10023170_002560 [Phytohabitans houttuyneae]|uniref:Uncharacterized protein n=1 Tax=Phytohabitans houttuyneae TaxID=1076126 RepID=A0A6V8K0H9_9ACTN|nr:hypothetical protein Phou_027920 [Phytohabitans houttuyneae]
MFAAPVKSSAQTRLQPDGVDGREALAFMVTASMPATTVETAAAAISTRPRLGLEVPVSLISGLSVGVVGRESALTEFYVRDNKLSTLIDISGVRPAPAPSTRSW